MSLDKLLMESKTNYKVYTPTKVAREIVAKALSFYFVGKNKRQKLNKLRAIDLSCGNGNLLLVLLESLIRIHKIYHGVYGYNEKWIEGFDLDEIAIEDFHLRFEELLEKYNLVGRINLTLGDSLTHNFKKSYNILIGNPPYMGEKNNREVFERIKNSEFGNKYYEGKMDYLYFFIEKGLDILDPKGVLSYITTNYWLRADGAKKLRDTIKNESSFVYINNINRSVFPEAIGQHNLIFTLQKRKNKELLLVNENERVRVSNKDIFDENGKISLLNLEDFEFCKILEKKADFILGDKCSINQGIVSGLDKAFVFHEFIEEFKEFLKPFYKNKDIHKYSLNKPEFYILYLDGEKKPNKKILDHLEPFRSKLETRREVKNGRIKWWQLQWSRDEKIFTEPKLVARQRNRENNFALAPNDFYASADVYYISTRENISLNYLLAYLNSQVFYRWFRLKGKYKGEFLELYATPLKEVPIIYENDKEKMKYIEELVEKQKKSYKTEIQEELDRFFENKVKN